MLFISAAAISQSGWELCTILPPIVHLNCVATPSCCTEYRSMSAFSPSTASLQSGRFPAVSTSYCSPLTWKQSRFEKSIPRPVHSSSGIRLSKSSWSLQWVSRRVARDGDAPRLAMARHSKRGTVPVEAVDEPVVVALLVALSDTDVVAELVPLEVSDSDCELVKVEVPDVEPVDVLVSDTVDDALEVTELV